MTTWTLHRLLMALVAATVGALLWNQYGMGSVLTLAPGGEQEVFALDDRSNGGHTVSTLHEEDGRWVLDCDVHTDYEWPYCELSIELAKAPLGVDLSSYDTVRLWVDYRGPELSFPCDADGNVPLDALSDRARNNYLFARAVVGRDYATPAVLPCGLQ